MGGVVVTNVETDVIQVDPKVRGFPFSLPLYEIILSLSRLLP